MILLPQGCKLQQIVTYPIVSCVIVTVLVRQHCFGGAARESTQKQLV
jgi:hypothetical protein